MRKGTVIEILHGNFQGRLAVVEQYYRATRGNHAAEVFVPGQTVDGGSLVTLPESSLRRVGYLRISSMLEGKWWDFLPRDGTRRKRSGLLRMERRSGRPDLKLIRRQAFWAYCKEQA